MSWCHQTVCFYAFCLFGHDSPKKINGNGFVIAQLNDYIEKQPN